MRKLCEITGEEGLKVLADIIDPATEIFTDDEVKNAVKTDKSFKKAIKIILNSHSKAVIEIMAAIDGVPVDEYKPKLMELPTRLIDIFSDPDLQSLF